MFAWSGVREPTFALAGRYHLKQRTRSNHLPSQLPMSLQISRIPFRLAWPFLPTMMWSCTAMPSGLAISMIALVIWISACDGVGSPEG